MNINPSKLLEQYPVPVVQALTELIQDKSQPCYISGGTVRDWFLDLKPKDLDLTVERNSFEWAEELATKLDGTYIPMNADEDVARVVWQGTCIDFSSFREGAETIEEDLLKRDFTINSLAIRFPAQITDYQSSKAPSGFQVYGHFWIHPCGPNGKANTIAC